jgi:hypothetical protein
MQPGLLRWPIDHIQALAWYSDMVTFKRLLGIVEVARPQSWLAGKIIIRHAREQWGCFRRFLEEVLGFSSRLSCTTYFSANLLA